MSPKAEEMGQQMLHNKCYKIKCHGIFRKYHTFKTRSPAFASLRFYYARTSFAIEAFAPCTGIKLVKLCRLPIVLVGMVFFCSMPVC